MIDIEKIKDKLLLLIEDEEWKAHLKWFIKSEDFSSIVKKLHFNSNELQLKFTPVIKDTFNPFIYCPYNDIKMIFLFDKPNSKYHYSNGIGIGKISYTEIGDIKIDNELSDILDAFNSSINKRHLKQLSRKGILFLNQSPTVMIGNPLSSHYDIWKEFIYFILDIINKYHKKLPILVFESEQSNNIINYLKSKHNVYEIFKTITINGKSTYNIKEPLLNILNKNNLNELKDKKN